MSDKETTYDQALRRVQGLLAQAESEAKLGNQDAVEALVRKASALMLKHSIDQAMLNHREKKTNAVAYKDFVEESNTPLVKVKRSLIAAVAHIFGGKPVLWGEHKRKADGSYKYDRRAKVRVFAEKDDLVTIETMYTSLLLQMQTMMNRDEPLRPSTSLPGKWRVSYGFGWVDAVYAKMQEAYSEKMREAEKQAPGTAIVVRDKSARVDAYVEANAGKLRNSRMVRSDGDHHGRSAGAQAGRTADVGRKRVTSANP